MSHFVPVEEEFFPLEEIIDSFIVEGVDEEILAVSQDFVPTNFQLLDEFLKKNPDGFCIKDLGEAVDHIQCLILAVQRYGFKAQALFDEFVEIAAKPLIETKSNEKLTTKGMESIEFFLTNLGELSIHSPAPFKIKLMTTIRRIINGGKNPSDLKSKSNNNNATISSPVDTFTAFTSTSQDTRTRVIDLEYMYERVKNSKLIKYLVEEFSQAATAMNYQSPSNNPTPTKSNHHGSDHSHHDGRNPNQMTREEELAFYGVPIPPKPTTGAEDITTTNNTNEGTIHSTTSTTSTAGSISQSPPPAIIIHSMEHESKAILRELTQLLLDVCLDLSNHHIDLAASFCEYRLSNAIILLLDKDFQHDARDHRISYLIELLWNILEAFTEQMRTQGTTALQQSLAMQQQTNPQEEWYPGDSKGPSAELPTFQLTEWLREYEETSGDIPIVDLAQAIPVLHRLLSFQLHDGFREMDKELRNEVVIVLTMLSEFPYAIGQFVHSELLHLLVTYACVEEMGQAAWPFFPKRIANSRNFATLSDTDLEFKKQLWNLVNLLLQSNDPDVILCVAASPLVACMMSYLEYDATTANPAPPTTAVGNHSLTTTPGMGTMMGGDGGAGGGVNKQELSSLLLDTMQQQSHVFSESAVLLSTHLTLAAATPFAFASHSGKHSQPQYQSLMAGERSSLLEGNLSKSMTGGFSKPPTGSLVLKPLPPGFVSSKPTTAFTSTTNTTNKPHTLSNTTNTTSANNVNNTTLNNTITNTKKKPYLTLLTPSKLKEFQLQSIIFFVQNIPKMLYEFQRIQGIPRILSLLMKFILSDQPEHRQLIYYSLLLITKCMLTSREIGEYLESHGGIAICLYLFLHCNEKEEDIRGGLVRMISFLCSFPPSKEATQAQFLSLQSISILLPVIRQYVTKRPALIGLKAGMKVYKHLDIQDPYVDPLDNPYSGDISVLILAIIHCFQTCVIGNLTNELALVEQDGLDLLLDLVEISPFVLRIHVFRLLSNLLSNSAILGFFYNWRSSKSFRSAGQMICHAWLDEEARVHSERTKDHGIISNLFDPLGNQAWAVAPFEVPLVGMFAATTGEEILSQSVTVSKLATAILAGRNAIQTNLPVHICMKVLQSDVRVILSDIIEKVGLYNMYPIQSAANPCKVHEEKALSIIQEWDESAPSPFDAMDPEVHYDRQGHASHKNGVSQIPSQSQSFERTGNQQTSPNRRAQQSFTAENATSIASGFEDGKLSPKELQVLSLAKKYLVLREGEWWRKVQEFVKQQGVLPIEADVTLMDARLEASFDAALAAQLEQMQMYETEEQLKKDDEHVFVDGILTKMHQQIKAEWSKKMARGGGAKKTMKQQREQSQQPKR